MAREKETLENELDPAEQELAGRFLRRRKPEKGGEEERGEEETSEGDDELSLSARLRQKQKKAREKESMKEGERKSIDAAAKQGTGTLLKAAWLNLITTFGLTLIYINLHVFLRWVLGEKFFCKLGDEWVPKQAKELAGEAGKLGGKAIGIVEVMLLILLDVIAGLIILIVLSFIILVVTWMAEWEEAGVIKKAWMVVEGIWNLGWKGVKALMDLFKVL